MRKNSSLEKYQIPDSRIHLRKMSCENENCFSCQNNLPCFRNLEIEKLNNLDDNSYNENLYRK